MCSPVPQNAIFAPDNNAWHFEMTSVREEFMAAQENLCCDFTLLFSSFEGDLLFTVQHAPAVISERGDIV
jgi:hypothetical protein